jgi:hypothetical protein
MPDSCAYCGSGGPLTKEHLFPAWMHRRAPDYGALFHAPAEEKLIGGEPRIKDVCHPCNSEILAKLDDYAIPLYDTYFANIVRAGESVVFGYDYDMLARWLLKVSYNFSRANHADDAARLAACTDYILYGHPRPDGLAVFVQLIIPYRLNPAEQLQVQADFPGVVEIPPLAHRISRANVPEIGIEFGVARMVALNSYHFYVLLPPYIESVNRRSRTQWSDALTYFQAETEGAQLLTPASTSITLYASPVDAKDMQSPHFLQFWELYNAKFGLP